MTRRGSGRSNANPSLHPCRSGEWNSPFRPPADGTGRYEAVFGVAPAFGAPETVLEFEPGLLDMPLPQANEDVLVPRLSEPPDADEVAELLHVGNRTLRYRLAAEGTSYRAPLSEAREHMDEELLISAGLPVEQIARRPGYVEVSSFSQAFRRWKGVGPREYRKHHPARRALPVSAR